MHANFCPSRNSSESKVCSANKIVNQEKISFKIFFALVIFDFFCTGN